MFKVLVLLLLPTLVFASGVSGCQSKPEAVLPAQTPNTDASTNEFKVLAEGFHSSVTYPFVAVVRDAETYAELTKLDSSVPPLDTEFFRGNAVIAAYLGTRNTGGYGVEIRREGTPGVDYPSPARAVISIAEKMPGKDVMVPQMVTSPFKIVSVRVNGMAPLFLSLDVVWRKQQQMYRIASGSFTMTGGFIGTSEQFAPHGEILVMRAGNLASYSISLAASGATRERFLADFATGTVQTDGRININSLSADLFVDKPNSGLKAIGSFQSGENKMFLDLRSLPTMVADGYQGQGHLEANLVAAESKP
jgi:hypothetical protein